MRSATRPTAARCQPRPDLRVRVHQLLLGHARAQDVLPRVQLQAPSRPPTELLPHERRLFQLLFVGGPDRTVRVLAVLPRVGRRGVNFFGMLTFKMCSSFQALRGYEPPISNNGSPPRLDKVSSTNALECCAQCPGNANCTGFVFDGVACYFKAATASIWVNRSANSNSMGYLLWTPPSPPMLPPSAPPPLAEQLCGTQCAERCDVQEEVNGSYVVTTDYYALDDCSRSISRSLIEWMNGSYPTLPPPLTFDACCGSEAPSYCFHDICAYNDTNCAPGDIGCNEDKRPTCRRCGAGVYNGCPSTNQSLDVNPCQGNDTFLNIINRQGGLDANLDYCDKFASVSCMTTYLMCGPDRSDTSFYVAHSDHGPDSQFWCNTNHGCSATENNTFQAHVCVNTDLERVESCVRNASGTCVLEDGTACELLPCTACELSGQWTGTERDRACDIGGVGQQALHCTPQWPTNTSLVFCVRENTTRILLQRARARAPGRRLSEESSVVRVTTIDAINRLLTTVARLTSVAQQQLPPPPPPPPSPQPTPPPPPPPPLPLPPSGSSDDVARIVLIVSASVVTIVVVYLLSNPTRARGVAMVVGAALGRNNNNAAPTVIQLAPIGQAPVVVEQAPKKASAQTGARVGGDDVPKRASTQTGARVGGDDASKGASTQTGARVGGDDASKGASTQTGARVGGDDTSS
jgi:hypothetical protein